jgi:FkbM family methyltransferase
VALSYPIILAFNRPRMSPAARFALAMALRFNGLLINFKGSHGINVGEERFLASVADRLADRVVLDVGANVGAYALCVRHFAPRAMIHAFEPHPKTFSALGAAAATHGIEAHRLAVSDKSGELDLYDFGDEDGSTQASLSMDAVALFGRGVVRHATHAITIDEFLDSRSIESVALLKIDAEGHDIAVVRGARRSIEAGRVDLIQFEFTRANVATRTFMRDFFDELSGYEIHRLCLNGALLSLHPYDIRACEQFVNQNLIAVRRGYLLR